MLLLHRWFQFRFVRVGQGLIALLFLIFAPFVNSSTITQAYVQCLDDLQSAGSSYHCEVFHDYCGETPSIGGMVLTQHSDGTFEGGQWCFSEACPPEAPIFQTNGIVGCRSNCNGALSADGKTCRNLNCSLVENVQQFPDLCPPAVCQVWQQYDASTNTCPAITCPANSTLNHTTGNCDVWNCPTGQHLHAASGLCVPDTCPTGQHNDTVTGNCVADPEPEPNEYENDFKSLDDAVREGTQGIKDSVDATKDSIDQAADTQNQNLDDIKTSTDNVEQAVRDSDVNNQNGHAGTHSRLDTVNQNLEDIKDGISGLKCPDGQHQVAGTCISDGFSFDPATYDAYGWQYLQDEITTGQQDLLDKKDEYAAKYSEIKAQIDLMGPNLSTGGALPVFYCCVVHGVTIQLDLNDYADELSVISTVVYFLAWVVAFQIIFGV